MALVDGVRVVTRESRSRRVKDAETIQVRFEGGTAAFLDAKSSRDRVWAEVLESLSGAGQPAYVEIDPDSHHITSLLLPRVLKVQNIREGTAGLEVDLEVSHARHFLRRDHEHFEELRALLERAHRNKAAVLVTESLDGSSIIDVRPVPGKGRSRSKRPRPRGN